MWKSEGMYENGMPCILLSISTCVLIGYQADLLLKTIAYNVKVFQFSFTRL